MGLGGDRLRQARLLQQHRDGIGLGTAVGGGNGRAAHRLRQDLLGKFEERLVDLFGGLGVLVALIGGTGQQGRQLWQVVVALQLFQIIKDGLLN